MGWLIFIFSLIIFFLISLFIKRIRDNLIFILVSILLITTILFFALINKFHNDTLIASLLLSPFFIIVLVYIIYDREKLNILKNLVNLNPDDYYKKKKNFLKGEHLSIYNAFNVIIKNYQNYLYNNNSLFSNIEKKVIELESKLNDLSDFLKKCNNNVSSLESSLSVLSQSIENEMKSLDDTTIILENNRDNFNILFESINKLLENNVELQNQNISMENASTEAIKFSLELDEITKRGVEKIDHIIGFINSINESIKGIADMLLFIKNISTQTRLLAFNASIEASHAGEHGHGFTVVAEEIRELSDSTSNATGKIVKIVKTITEELSKDKDASIKAKEGVEEISNAFTKNIDFINFLADGINQQIASIENTKAIIEEIYNLSKILKDSTESQESKSRDIYESSEILNSQTFLISQILKNQQEDFKSISFLFNEIKEAFLEIKNDYRSIKENLTNLTN